MYNVNREKIEEILSNLSSVLNNIRPLLEKNPEEFINNKIAVLALERALHVAIESVIDVGNYIIDGFIMRDPGSYLDIIEILRDEQVITDSDAANLKGIVSYRKTLVNEYTTLIPEKIYNLMVKEYLTLLNFQHHIRSYLIKELG